MILTYWLFVGMDVIYLRPASWLLWPLTRRGIIHGVWGHESGLWLWLAGLGYLYSDWRRGDMPEHLRVGGVWR